MDVSTADIVPDAIAGYAFTSTTHAYLCGCARGSGGEGGKRERREIEGEKEKKEGKEYKGRREK